MSANEFWLPAQFRIRIGRKYEWRKGWLRGPFGIHSYKTISDHGPEQIEVDVFALTHLPSGCRMGGAFTIEDAMAIFEIINGIEDWFELSSRKQSREPRWHAAYERIGTELCAAGFGYAMDHQESRVMVRVGSTWPPQQPALQ